MNRIALSLLFLLPQLMHAKGRSAVTATNNTPYTVKLTVVVASGPKSMTLDHDERNTLNLRKECPHSFEVHAVDATGNKLTNVRGSKHTIGEGKHEIKFLKQLLACKQYTFSIETSNTARIKLNQKRKKNNLPELEAVLDFFEAP